MSTPVLKVNEDFLSIRNIEYFPSGSMSSFQPSIELSSEEEQEFNNKDEIGIKKSNIINYEQGLEKISNSPDEELQKALNKIKTLKQALKHARMELVRTSNEENLQQRLNLAFKENKELKAELIVYSKQLFAVEKSLKDTKANLKKVEKQKNFLFSQLKIVCTKILSTNSSDKAMVNSNKLFQDDFYLTIFEKIDYLSRPKNKNPNSEITSPLKLLSPQKAPELPSNISKSVQTEPDLDHFYQKYWTLRNFGDRAERIETIVKSEEDLKKSDEKVESLNIEKFSYRNVFKDLKEIGSFSTKGTKKFEFDKTSVTIKSFMDSKIASKK